MFNKLNKKMNDQEHTFSISPIGNATGQQTAQALTLSERDVRSEQNGIVGLNQSLADESINLKDIKKVTTVSTIMAKNKEGRIENNTSKEDTLSDGKKEG